MVNQNIKKQSGTDSKSKTEYIDSRGSDGSKLRVIRVGRNYYKVKADYYHDVVCSGLDQIPLAYKRGKDGKYRPASQKDLGVLTETILDLEQERNRRALS